MPAARDAWLLTMTADSEASGSHLKPRPEPSFPSCSVGGAPVRVELKPHEVFRDEARCDERAEHYNGSGGAVYAAVQDSSGLQGLLMDDYYICWIALLVHAPPPHGASMHVHKSSTTTAGRLDIS